MEPRNSNRGKDRLPGDPQIGAVAFNGAPEFQPGKAAGNSRSGESVGPFNGAPEFQPGKAEDDLAIRRRELVPSMEPRNSNRGKGDQ